MLLIAVASSALADEKVQIPALAFESANQLTTRIGTIEPGGNRIVVIEKTGSEVSELVIDLQGDTMIATRRSPMAETRNILNLGAVRTWAKANPADAQLVQENFDRVLSTFQRKQSGTSAVKAGGCGSAIQDVIATADAMALACGGYTGGTVACNSAIHAYYSARDTLMRCMIQMY